MITKTLADSLRMMYIEMQSKNPGGVEGFDTPLFFEAIAQAEREAQAGELSDGDALKIAHEWGSEMGHVKQFMEWARPRINARIKGPVITHLNMDPNASPETIEAVKDVVQKAYSYKPSQAIGEPVAYTMSRDYGALYEHLKAGGEAFGYIDYVWHNGSVERVHAHVSRNENNGLVVDGRYKLHLTEGRTQADTVQTCQRLNLEWVAPMSPEARDMAIEALATTQHLWMCEDEGMVSGQPTARDYRRAREKVDQALSALRGEPGAKP